MVWLNELISTEYGSFHWVAPGEGLAGGTRPLDDVSSEGIKVFRAA
ncbi:MAG: hypothetical protein WD770_01680 [Actinomycetota bacterium]